MDVSFEDQQKINTFSRLNARLHELEAKVASKKRAAEDFEEAGNEVMLLDDETVPFVIGECMVHLPREDVEERLEKMKDNAENEAQGFQDEIDRVRGEMAELKTVLYAKFGNSINLEE